MKDFVTDTIKNLPPSGIRQFFELVIGMEDVISLGVGEPDFSTPWNICEAALYSIENGLTSYTSNSGLLELRQLISKHILKRSNVRFRPEKEILITVGVSEGLDLAMRTILDPGQELVIPEPCYVSYAPTVILAGGKPVAISTDPAKGFKLTPEELEAAITDKTRAILINYPCNPTGASYSADELEALAAVAKKHDLLIMSDEIYDELTYDHKHTPMVMCPSAAGRTLYFNGFSKAHAMTGWRIGYVAGPADIIAGMTKIHQYTMLCAPISGQVAACEALKNGAPAVEKMKTAYHRRRNFIVEGLNEIGLNCHMPEGSFYVFPSIRKFGLSSTEFCTRLLTEEKVAVVPGTAFGQCGEGHVRMCYAVDIEDIKTALSRIKNFCSRL
ncbi:aminotransferase class I/II-fold pyridoxal phosphate-dependent enzyme [Oscillibacter sp.]|uniref:aminotransferase class I/II-fold pyridoxal phosphate-dependent enzyme n=1 Tax=Oscillibacter sp. TaxID=1945593 RepID=UPI0026314DA5|nr:aminotransferase class I/II-fold pyridoxal phosphate-dependent enzyme [Oscillibacter sp.]MDD3347625.1 aminotransferase class I/II-fold pyridoxal phosphate-dependent enzyme [Oscillibacter sp.]